MAKGNVGVDWVGDAPLPDPCFGGVDWAGQPIEEISKVTTTLELLAPHALLRSGSGDRRRPFLLGENGLPQVSATRHSSLLVWTKLDPGVEASFQLYIGIENGEYVLKAHRDWSFSKLEELEIRYGR